jgi:hypothetical protein
MNRLSFALLLLAALLPAAPARAAEAQYIPAGELITHFDWTSHYTDPTQRTFPENDGHSFGMTALPDGRVAMLFSDTDSTPFKTWVYLFTIDPNASPVWSIAGGPITLEVADARRSCHGLASMGDGSLATLSSWYVDDGSGHLNWHHKIYKFTPPGGALTEVADLGTTAGSWAQNLAYLPAQGNTPAQWAIDAWTQRQVVLTSLGGAVQGTIPYTEATFTPDGCHSAGGIEATPNGDLLLAGDRVGSNAPCPHYNNVIASRLTRAGAFRGTFAYGYVSNPVTTVGWYDFCQLANGDILSGGDAGSIDSGNGRLYRYYIIRPPSSLQSPKLLVTPESLNFVNVIENTAASQTLTLKNVGAAALNLTGQSLSGGGAGAYRLGTPGATQLAPSYGLPGAAGSTTSLTVYFEPKAFASYTAQAEVRSNDPVTTQTSVPLTGLAVTRKLSNATLVTASAIDSQSMDMGAMAFKYDDPNRLLLMLTVLTSDGRRGRLYEIPLTRDAEGKITGLVTANKSLLATTSESLGGLLQGRDGVIWHTRLYHSGRAVIQRRADGSLYESNVPAGYAYDGPRDFDFTPDGQGLIVLYYNTKWGRRLGLTARADGFWQLSGTAGAYLFYGSSVSCFKLWPDAAGNADMVQSSGKSLMYYDVPAGFWQAGQGTMQAREVAQGLDITHLCRDPLRGDLLYANGSDELHVLQGLETYSGLTPHLAFIRAHLLGQTPLTAEQTTAADVNHDGKVDVADVVGKVLAGN